MINSAKYYYLNKKKIYDFINYKDKFTFLINLLSIYVLIILSFYLFSLFLHLEAFFFVIIGLLQYLLVQALHEAWHYHKGKSYFETIFVTNILSFLLFIPLTARKIHFHHHKNLGDSINDPDYVIPPENIYQLIFQSIFYLSGIDAIKRYFKLNNISDLSKERFYEKTINSLSILSVQILFFFNLNFFFNIVFIDFIILWVLPLITIVNFLNKIRLIAEHGIGYGGTNLKSFSKNNLINRFLGAFGFVNHAEHHVYPNIRYYSLEKIKKDFNNLYLNDKNIVKVEYINNNYFSYIFSSLKKIN
jgi:fatty acid desaturase